MEDYTPSADCVAVCDTFTAVVRSTKGCPAHEISLRLGSSGLLGLLAASEFGGSGLSFRVAAEVVRVAGFVQLDMPLAETLLALWLMGDHPAAASVLSGAARVTSPSRGALRARHDGERRRVTGRLWGAPAGSSSQWLLAWLEDPEPALLVLDLSDASVVVEAGSTFDPHRSYDEVRVDGLEVAESSVLRCSRQQAAAFRSMQHVLHVAEMLGGAQACFEAAQERASTRRQFGKLLVAHQTIRHQLARDHVRLAGAALSIQHAASQCDHDPLSDVAAIARDVAVSTAIEVCLPAIENAIQLHGALGFTWDAGFHLYLRRARKLAQVYDAASARRRLGQTLWPPTSP